MKKHSKVLFSLFSFVLFSFYSCENDDYNLSKDKNLDSHLILEAQTYFEDYASIEMEGEPTGLHPGNIAPEWDKARVFTNSGSLAINIPLITEATYEGSFYDSVDTVADDSRDTYSTAMLQKLVVVKSLETEIYSCYIATIIPSKEYSTKNSSKIDKMFYSGDPDSKFSGTVVYSTVTTNYTIAVEKYINGIMHQQKSLYYTDKSLNEYLNEMSQLLCSAGIKRNVRVMTKNGEFGGNQPFTLPEVIITPTPRPTPPPPPPSLPPPYIPPATLPSAPPEPPIYPPGYVPPTSPPPTGSGNSGNGTGQQHPLQLKSPAPEYDEITQKVNKVIVSIYNKLKEMGIDLENYKIEIVMSCATNARKEENGTIGICASFVNKGYELNDQTSIIWHEIFHFNNDKECSMNSQKLPSTIMYSNIPSYIEKYIVKDLYGGNISESEYKKVVSGWEYQNLITAKTINAPEYYQNEINTYKAEIKNGISVSPAYAEERKFLLWKNEQLLAIAKKYYK